MVSSCSRMLRRYYSTSHVTIFYSFPVRIALIACHNMRTHARARALNAAHSIAKNRNPLLLLPSILACDHPHISGVRLTATSYDSLETCKKKYKKTVVESLETLAAATPRAAVLHDFDATRIGASFARQQDPGHSTASHDQEGQGGAKKKKKKQRNKKFDFIVFNFPHTGDDSGLDDSIRSNRKLVQLFAKSATEVLKPGGEIHVTVVNRYPYTAWKVGLLDAAAPGLLDYCGTVPFDPVMYQGYKHVTTTMDGRDSRYEVESALTHVYKRRA